MRKVLSMDKQWKFNVHNAEEERPYKYPSHIDFYKVKAGYEDGYASISYNDHAWRKLNIPHDRLCETPFTETETLFHGGRERECMWYRKSFCMDEKYKDKHFLLCFEGIACASEIYFNGSLIKRSYSPYDEITVDLTERMHFGKNVNVLAVYVDGTKFDGWWCEGAGIYRHVNLYIKDALHIMHNGVFVNPSYKGHDLWDIETEITIENTDYTSKVCCAEIKLTDKHGKVILTEKTDEIAVNADSKVTVKHIAGIRNPMLWDINDPNLYEIEVTLYSNDKPCDSEQVMTGFRYFCFDAETGFYLNGKNIKIKGAAIHQDHAGVGAAIPDSVCDYRVRKLKEAGCNFYRCAHNPHSRAVYDACDRHGILVMDENRHLETSDEAINSLETMVRRDRNHPSVIMYSIFNEEPLEGSIEGKNIFKRLKSRVKALDDSKIIIGCMHTGWFDADGIAFEMDVVGFNYSPIMQEKFHEMYPEKPSLGTEELSNFSTRGCYKTDDEMHVMNSMESERSYHWNIHQMWDFTRKNSYMSGFVCWAGIDYRGEPTPFQFPSVITQYGMMDNCGFPKTNYYYTKACFSEDPMIHIEPHWNHKKGEVVKTKVITNCQETELFLNGKSLGRVKVDVCNPPTWEIEYEEGLLEAKGFVDGKEILTTARKTAAEPYAVKLLPDRISIKNDSDDAVVVNVCVVDKNGNLVPDASQLINFEIEGGKIIGVGNGNPNSLESDVESHRKLYMGYCQVILQSIEKTQELKLTASSDGLVSDVMYFEIENVLNREIVEETDNCILGGWTLSLTDFVNEPEPDFFISDWDFNSFVPIIMNPNRYQLYTDCWKIYRTKINLIDNNGLNKKCTIHIENILCEEARAYANGRLVFETSLVENEPITIKFDSCGDTEIDFRIHICARKNSSTSGLRRTITFMSE